MLPLDPDGKKCRPPGPALLFRKRAERRAVLGPSKTSTRSRRRANTYTSTAVGHLHFLRTQCRQWAESRRPAGSQFCCPTRALRAHSVGGEATQPAPVVCKGHK